MAALTIAVALALTPALTASATTYRVPSTGLQATYVDGSWINHTTFRDKTTNTYATWSTIQRTCALDLRLRSTTTNPVTGLIYVANNGTTGTFWANNTGHPEDGRLKAGSYAFSSRSFGTYGCPVGQNIGWAGNLTW